MSSLYDRLRQRLRSSTGIPQGIPAFVPGEMPPPAWLHSPEGLSAAQAQVLVLELQRRASEYFELIGKLERERDQWRQMFHDQTGANHQTQGYLYNGLQRVNQAVIKALALVNKTREREGQPPLKVPRDLAQLEVDATHMIDQFVEMYRELLRHGPRADLLPDQREAPGTTNAQEAREAIERNTEAYWEEPCVCGHPRRRHTLGERHCLHGIGVDRPCGCPQFRAQTEVVNT